MSELIILVVDDPNKIDAIVEAWLNVDVPGVTMLDSAGLGYYFGQQGTRDDMTCRLSPPWQACCALARRRIGLSSPLCRMALTSTRLPRRPKQSTAS